MSDKRRVEFQTFRIELDQTTAFSDVKKNKINSPIKSIRIGLSSSPSVLLKVKFKEGDEMNLWPGRILNLTEKSSGLSLSWSGQVNEWVDIEVSDSGHFDSGDYPPVMSNSSSLGATYRKNELALDRVNRIQIASLNLNRISCKIENNSGVPILVGDFDLLDPGISSLIRKKNCFRIMPFSFENINITGEIWAIMDTAFSAPIGDASYSSDVVVTEILK